MKDFFKKIKEKVKNLDLSINNYKNQAKDVVLPSHAFNNWAMELLKEQNDEEAYKKLEISANMGAKNPQTFLNLGLYKLKHGQYESAIEYLNKAIFYDRYNEKAYAFLGSCYLECKDFDKCRQMFKKSLKINGRNSQTYLNYAIALTRMGDIKEAHTAFYNANLFNPSNTDVLYLWGMFLFENNDFKNALEKFKQIQEITPFHPDSIHSIALCLQKLGDFRGSISYSKKYLSLIPEDIEGYIVLAESYMAQGKKDECFDTYKKGEESLKESKKSFRFHYSKGVALQTFDLWEEAILEFEIAKSIEENNFLAPYGLSLSYLKLKQMDKAYDNMQKTLELNPNHTTTLYNMGQYMTECKEYDKAIEYFKRALKTTSNGWKFYFNIALCNEMKGDMELASYYFEKMLENDPDNTDALVNLANIYSNMGENQKAIRKIRSAYIKHKDDPNIILVYAVHLLKENLLYDAMEKFKQAYDLDRNLIMALYGRCECLVKLNKPKEALGILNNFENTNGGDKDFLMIKLLAYLKLQEDEEDNSEYYKNIALDICDKIILTFGENEWVQKTKEKLENKEGIKWE